ncbi:hypothetical protein B0H19DRAFT_1238918 [Mycena capillaripes]|nr:hypothetical protein B0H19DRAFT_1238918 [Mycena capillaripes]
MASRFSNDFESVRTWLSDRALQTVYHYTVLSYSKPLSLIDGDWWVHSSSLSHHFLVNPGLSISFNREDPYCFSHPNVRMIILLHIGLPLNSLLLNLTHNQWRRNIGSLRLSSLLYVGKAFGICEYPLLFVIAADERFDTPTTCRCKCRYFFDRRSFIDTNDRSIFPLDNIQWVMESQYVEHTDLNPWTRSKKLFKALMLYAMNRFILTTSIRSVVVIVQTIVLIVKPDSVWAMVLDVITVHLYVNSLLATLNARQKLRAIGPQSKIGNASVPNILSGSRRYSSTEPNRAKSDVQPAQVDLFPRKMDGGDAGEQEVEQYSYRMSNMSDDRHGKTPISECQLGLD